MIHIVDMRGKPCPQPVIAAKKALQEQGAPLIVWVDDEIARQNVEKLAVQLGLSPASDRLEDGSCRIVIQPVASAVLDAVLAGDAAAMPEPGPMFPLQEAMPFPMEELTDLEPQKPQGPAKRPTVVVLSAQTMGTGDDELGAALMKGFVYALGECDELPDDIVLYNGGVKLAAEGTDTAGDLRGLAAAGVRVHVCGACLQHYGLTDRLGAGEVTNMYEIARLLMRAGRVVRP